jgi:hypothetical protein
MSAMHIVIANHELFSLYVFLSTRIPAIIHVFGTQKVLKIPQRLPENYTIRHKFGLQAHNMQSTSAAGFAQLFRETFFNMFRA